jgi:16S rRNA (guanine527-N7)-methyltransferase
VLDETNTARLIEGARHIGVALEPRDVERLGRYLALLRSWGRHINLTGLTAPVDVVDRHFVDSLAVVPVLRPGSSLLDVGSGAGFPGAVVAVARPDLRVTLCESRAKKAAFLRALRQELRLSVEVVHGRSEELAQDRPPRLFDAVIARAVLPLERWLEHGARFVAADGHLLAMVGPVPVRLAAIAGFAPLAPHGYELPGGTTHHLLRWHRLP